MRSGARICRLDEEAFVSANVGMAKKSVGISIILQLLLSILSEKHD